MNGLLDQAAQERDLTLNMIKDHFGRHVEKRTRTDMATCTTSAGSLRAATERDFVKQRLRDLCRWTPGRAFQ